MNNLFLQLGNPKDKPASYTRFVLPFAWKAVRHDESEPSDYKRLTTDSNDRSDCPKLPDCRWRRQYLTSETAMVLFDRAGWFEYQKSADQLPDHFTDELLGEKLQIKMSLPRLVLFEWKPKPVSLQEEQNRNPLHTGFLILELFFDERPRVTLDQLLLLNERFRYCREPWDGHPDRKYEKINSYKEVIGLTSAEDNQTDEALYSRRWLKWIKEKVIEDQKGAKYKLEVPDDKQEDCMIYADDRTFVWTCAILQGGAKSLSTVAPDEKPRACNYGHWIKLLNVDPPGGTPVETHRHSEFESQWADERTYHRWEHFGTYHGFSYHSGAMIGPSLEDPPLWKHFGQMYFDQVLLLFYLRVTLFRFSRELCDISGEGINDKEWLEKFQKIREKFSIFTNLYQFPLVSNQQQGLELYALARKALDVDALFREIQEEVGNSHAYFLQKDSHEQTKVATEQTIISTRLTVVATVGFIITFILALWGIDGIGPFTGLTKPAAPGRILISIAIALIIAMFLQTVVIFSVDAIGRCFRKLAEHHKSDSDLGGNK